MSDFLLGVVLGVVIGWLVDWLLFRRQMQGEADALRVELQAAQGQSKDMERKLEAHSAEIHALRDRLGSAQENVTRFEGVQMQFDSAQGELAQLRAQVTEYEQAHGALSGELGQLRTQLADYAQTQGAFEALQGDYSSAQSEIDQLRADLAACAQSREELDAAQVEIEELRTRLAHVLPAAPIDSPAIVPDNLQRIEGIGPKINQVLHAAGVLTFAQLAASPVERLQAILDAAGISRVNDPATWAEQAGYIVRGDLGGLQALQESLKGGRRA